MRLSGCDSQREDRSQECPNPDPIPSPSNTASSPRSTRLMALCDRLEAIAGRAGSDEGAAGRGGSRAARRTRSGSGAHSVQHAAFVLDHLAPLTARRDQIKALRRTILNLAVRGKLVQQDPNDEPISGIVAPILARRREGEKGRSRKTTRLSSIPGYDVPQGWLGYRIYDRYVRRVTDGDHLPPPKTESGIPLLVIGDVRSQTINFAASTICVIADTTEISIRFGAQESGDLLYTLVGSYGIPVVVRDDRAFCVQRHIGILKPSELIDVDFLARRDGERHSLLPSNCLCNGHRTEDHSALWTPAAVGPAAAPDGAALHWSPRSTNSWMVCDRLEASVRHGRQHPSSGVRRSRLPRVKAGHNSHGHRVTTLPGVGEMLRRYNRSQTDARPEGW